MTDSVQTIQKEKTKPFGQYEPSIKGLSSKGKAPKLGHKMRAKKPTIKKPKSIFKM